MARAKGAQKARGEGIAAGRVPQIMQMEAVECGAACLAMVSAYYDKWIPLDQVRRDCGVGRDGAKASNVARAAQRYGFKVQAYRFEPERMREKATFPCIVHWNMYHFVVVRGFKGDKVLINDPARGEYTCDMQTFNKSFTGICICLQPDEGFQTEGSKPSMVAFAAKNLKDAKGALAFVAFTTLLTAIVGLMNPAMSQMFITRLLTQHNERLFAPFMAVLLGVAAIQVAAAVLNSVYLLKVQGKLDVSAASSYMWKMLHLPLDFFSQRSVGDISSRLGTTAGISKNLVSLLAPMVINAGMLVVYLVILLCYSPMLACVGLTATVVNTVTAWYVSRKRMDISRVKARDAANLAAATLAGIQTVETIKASGAENGFFRTWSTYQAEANAQQVRAQNLNVKLGMVPAAASSVANAAVLALGLMLVMQGEFTTGMVLAFQGYLAQFAAPAEQLVNSLKSLTEMRVDMERIQDVTDAPLDPMFQNEGPGELTLTDPKGRIRLQDVSFGYNRQETPLIQGFSLVVEPGESVAFVGGSGSGKSTVANMIAGLAQPWEGTVTLDGVKLGDIPRAAFTDVVSMVSQEVTVLADTVSNNIRLWDDSYSESQVMEAARDAALHEDVLRMQDGYRHMLTENGGNLSGGQRQRVEIARALLRNPKVLIMDEATSALDALTEARVMEAVRRRGTTLVVVAHRLSTVRDCDQIVVFDHGKVVERGTHDELMALDGAYAALVRQG